MMQPFRPRQIRFHGFRRPGDWRLKLYSILYGQGPFNWEAFEPGLAMAETSLPSPAVGESRMGVGFLIAHQGRTGNYVVLGWWDRENELPIRVFVGPDGQRESWRPSRDSESFCVWDLEIIWAERQTYVATVLAPTGSNVEAYLAQSYDVVGSADFDGI